MIRKALIALSLLCCFILSSCSPPSGNNIPDPEDGTLLLSFSLDLSGIEYVESFGDPHDAIYFRCNVVLMGSYYTVGYVSFYTYIPTSLPRTLVDEPVSGREVYSIDSGNLVYVDEVSFPSGVHPGTYTMTLESSGHSDGDLNTDYWASDYVAVNKYSCDQFSYTFPIPIVIQNDSETHTSAISLSFTEE